MKPLRRPRPFIAWLLYVSVLFNLLACSAAHGHLSGSQLSGLGLLACSSSDQLLASPDVAVGVLGELIATCVLCGGLLVGVAAALFFSRLERQSPNVSVPSRERRMPPRYLWPSANPRASPAA